MEFKVIKAKSLEEMSELLKEVVEIYDIHWLTNIIQEGKYLKVIAQVTTRVENGILAKDFIVAKPENAPKETELVILPTENKKTKETKKAKGVKHGRK